MRGDLEPRWGYQTPGSAQSGRVTRRSSGERHEPAPADLLYETAILYAKLRHCQVNARSVASVAGAPGHHRHARGDRSEAHSEGRHGASLGSDPYVCETRAPHRSPNETGADELRVHEEVERSIGGLGVAPLLALLVIPSLIHRVRRLINGGERSCGNGVGRRNVGSGTVSVVSTARDVLLRTEEPFSLRRGATASRRVSGVPTAVEIDPFR
jgi:hypothetical protein